MVMTVTRLLFVLGLVIAALSLLLGPTWRGSFYRSWLRPRLVAFGVGMALITGVIYAFKVVNVLHH
ncbi:MAG TPA: hypothetical protein VJO72_10735 [Candidatus Dormibacteraeota bacterium]|nr:hypothetical protein [Candidatus Dormibacteraeota bacterium]